MNVNRTESTRYVIGTIINQCHKRIRNCFVKTFNAQIDFFVLVTIGFDYGEELFKLKFVVSWYQQGFKVVYKIKTYFVDVSTGFQMLIKSWLRESQSFVSTAMCNQVKRKPALIGCIILLTSTLMASKWSFDFFLLFNPFNNPLLYKIPSPAERQKFSQSKNCWLGLVKGNAAGGSGLNCVWIFRKIKTGSNFCFLGWKGLPGL